MPRERHRRPRSASSASGASSEQSAATVAVPVDVSIAAWSESSSDSSRRPVPASASSHSSAELCATLLTYPPWLQFVPPTQSLWAASVVEITPSALASTAAIAAVTAAALAVTAVSQSSSIPLPLRSSNVASVAGVVSSTSVAAAARPVIDRTRSTAPAPASHLERSVRIIDVSLPRPGLRGACPGIRRGRDDSLARVSGGAGARADPYLRPGSAMPGSDRGPERCTGGADGCGASRQRQIAAVRPGNVSEAVVCRLEIGTSSRTILSPSKPAQKASIEASRGAPDRSPADPRRDRDRLRDRPPHRRALSDPARPGRPRAGLHPGPAPHRARARPRPAGLPAAAAVHRRGRIADPRSAGERRPARPALDRPGAVHDGPRRGRGARRWCPA